MSIISQYFENKNSINWPQVYEDLAVQIGRYAVVQADHNANVRSGAETNELPLLEFGDYRPVKLYMLESYNRNYKAYEVTNHNKIQDFDLENNKADGAVMNNHRRRRNIPVLENLEKGLLVFAPFAIYSGDNGLPYQKSLDIGRYNRDYVYVFNMIEGTIIKLNINTDNRGKGITLVRPEDITNNYEKYIEEDELTSEGFYFSDFIERVYDIKPGALDNKMSFYTYFKLLRYTGNLFQSLLNFSTESTWFIQNLGDTITSFGQKLEVKNLQSWFNMNLPDFRYLISQPTSDMFIFYQIARKYKEISLTEFLKIEKNITTLNNKWLKEFDRNLSGSKSREDRIYLKGERGRNIMSSQTLPQFMIKYVNNRIFKTTPLYKYVKYIVDEGVKAYKDGHKLSLKDIEDYLYDYNHMLKEINPKAKFVMPYKLKNAHDTMVNNYNIIQRENAVPETVGRKTYSEVYGIADEKCFKDAKYMIARPAKDSDLAIEGSTLNHCVGSYSSRVLSGECMIFFCRKATKPNEPFVTIEVRKQGEDNFSLYQIKGKHNKDYMSTYGHYSNDQDVVEVRTFVESWLKAYRQNYVEKKEQMRIARQLEQYASKNYDLPIVQYLHLQGYKQFYYDKNLSKEENYTNTITSAFVHIIHEKKKSDMWDDEFLSIMRSDMKKVLKELNIKHKDVMPFTDDKYIELASYDYQIEDIVSISKMVEREKSLIGLATKEVQKELIKLYGEPVIEEIPENQIAMEL